MSKARIYSEILRVQTKTKDRVTAFLRQSEEDRGFDSGDAIELLRDILIDASNCLAAAGVAGVEKKQKPLRIGLTTYREHFSIQLDLNCSGSTIGPFGSLGNALECYNLMAEVGRSHYRLLREAS